MSLWSKIFQRSPDPKEELRPLWHEIVKVARSPSLYAECGVEDSLEGRFDMLSTMLSLAIRKPLNSPLL